MICPYKNTDLDCDDCPHYQPLEVSRDGDRLVWTMICELDDEIMTREP